MRSVAEILANAKRAQKSNVYNHSHHHRVYYWTHGGTIHRMLERGNTMNEKLNESHVFKCHECHGTGKCFDLYCDTCLGIGNINALDGFAKYYLPLYS